MRNRDYKQFGPGEYYHVYNRGNGKKNIFLDDEDYKFFLLRLRQNLYPDTREKHRFQLLPQNSFSLVSYCLMSNHFHFLLRQNSEVPTTKLIAKLCTSYSMYFNKKYEHVGHVFQDRYKQINIFDDEYLVWLSLYVHLNPKTAGIVSDPSKYPWSSCADFVGKHDENMCDKSIIMDRLSAMEYENLLVTGYEIIKSKNGLKELLIDDEY